MRMPSLRIKQWHNAANSLAEAEILFSSSAVAYLDIFEGVKKLGAENLTFGHLKVQAKGATLW